VAAIDASPKYLLTDIPAANPDVESVVAFPDHADRAFPGGERVKVLLGLRNTGNDAVNVTHLAGSLNVPNNFNFYVTNFTVSSFGDAVIKPKKEATFEYEFAIDPQFAGHSLQLALTAFYDEAGVAYATTYFNSTVPVLDPKVVFDRELAVIYLTLAGVAYLCFAGVMKAAGLGHLVPFIGEAKPTTGATKKTYVKKVEKKGTTSASASDSEQWLEGTAFARSSSKKEKKKQK
jgi:translocon-associated protein subunit alpha